MEESFDWASPKKTLTATPKKLDCLDKTIMLRMLIIVVTLYMEKGGEMGQAPVLTGFHRLPQQ
jgi:hypothetical protein